MANQNASQDDNRVPALLAHAGTAESSDTVRLTANSTTGDLNVSDTAGTSGAQKTQIVDAQGDIASVFNGNLLVGPEANNNTFIDGVPNQRYIPNYQANKVYTPAFNHFFNGSTWDRFRGDATDGLLTHQSIDNEALIAQAIGEISNTYGDTVSVASKQKSLLKVGDNPSVGTATTGFTIWATGVDQAHETYPAANSNPITHVSSSSASDTFTFLIEGHTESGGTSTFITQPGTLNGQTPVALGTALHRATRMVNTGTANNVGTVYTYQGTAVTGGKPDDTTLIHLSMVPGKNQTEKASTSLSSTDYWIVTNFFAGYKTKTGSNFADIDLQYRTDSESVFISLGNMVVSTGFDNKRSFDPYVVIPKNADVRLSAISSAADQDIQGGIQGYLATTE